MTRNPNNGMRRCQVCGVTHPRHEPCRQRDLDAVAQDAAAPDQALHGGDAVGGAHSTGAGAAATADWERLRDWRKLSENAVKMDRWDRLDWQRAHTDITPLRAATGELAEAIDTGDKLMADVFALLMKAAPEFHGRDEVRPEGWLQHAVATQIPGLSDYATLRRFTRGSAVDAALACASLEPDVETLVDRQRQRHTEAQRLQDRLDALRAAEQTKIDLDEMMQRWLADNDEPDEKLAADQADAAGAVDDLADEIAELTAALEATDNDAAAVIRGRLAVAFHHACENAKAEAQLASAIWGTERGRLRHLPIEERLALGRKLNNPRIRSIAEKFGAIHNLSLADRMHTNPMMVDEIVGVTLGREIPKLVPAELAKLHDPLRRWEFYKDFAEGRLLQFDYTGTERASKGAIILLKDISGSMDGEPEMWGSAFHLNLMDIARQEGRGFYLIAFGAADELYEYDFTSPASWTTDRIFESITAYSGYGTDFETPLGRAVEKLTDEYRATGRTSGDVVMITDGHCGVREQWKAWYHEEAARLGFRTWGCLIGQHRETEPLWSICSHNVMTVRDFAGGGDVRHVFQGI